MNEEGGERESFLSFTFLLFPPPRTVLLRAVTSVVVQPPAELAEPQLPPLLPCDDQVHLVREEDGRDHPELLSLEGGRRKERRKSFFFNGDFFFPGVSKKKKNNIKESKGGGENHVSLSLSLFFNLPRRRARQSGRASSPVGRLA